MGDHFPVREKSGNCDQTGKVREFYPKYWKNQKMGINTGKVVGNLAVRKVKTMQIWCYTLNKNSLIILENFLKYWKFVSPKKWEP